MAPGGLSVSRPRRAVPRPAGGGAGHAIRPPRSASLEKACAAAWSEWEAGEDAELWGRTDTDGIAEAAR